MIPRARARIISYYISYVCIYRTTYILVPTYILVLLKYMRINLSIILTYVYVLLKYIYYYYYYIIKGAFSVPKMCDQPYFFLIKSVETSWKNLDKT